MTGSWQFAGSSQEGEPFAIRGADIWRQEAHITDLVDGKEYIFHVFTIPDGDQKVEFAAGEFSPGQWGFYTRD